MDDAPSTTFHEKQPQDRLGEERLGQDRLGPQQRLGPQERLRPQERLGPTTRSMTKRVNEEWDKATDGRKTFLYMFTEAHPA